jgi:hypothetical protein
VVVENDFIRPKVCVRYTLHTIFTYISFFLPLLFSSLIPKKSYFSAFFYVRNAPIPTQGPNKGGQKTPTKQKRCLRELELGWANTGRELGRQERASWAVLWDRTTLQLQLWL